MKICFGFIFALCFSFSRFSQLDISFLNVESTENDLVVSIYNSENSFDSKEAFIRSSVSTNRGEMSYKRNGLKPGYYVVTVFHDLNGNGKFDKNFIGMPKEPYGVSNNLKEQFGPPKYERVKFYYDGNAMSLSIRIDDN
ncbi:DUF2141 domain-containing protein [Ekhidna sp.]